jgi:hypothetical protein
MQLRSPARLFQFDALERRQLLAVPGTTLGGYHTYATVTSDLQAYASYAPSITQLVSIGKSVNNRDLWALKITDNPTVQEDEPEFAYLSTMHGNEPVGTEMSLYFINDLLTGYGSNTTYTNLINTTEIWIIPLINPDGLTSNSRYNANTVDLNRNFPEGSTTNLGNVLDGPAPSTSGRAVETRALMSFFTANNINLGANFHTGATVVNYPYDTNNNGIYDYAASPDDSLFRELALTYSRQNLPMYNSLEFPQGITNGDQWYEVSGGMQDWTYRYNGSLHVTIELSDTFKPAASTLPALWNNNKTSMLNYLSAVHWGVRGVVTNVQTNAPVRAKVTLAGNPISSFTDADAGDYHRPLLPGTYSFTVSAPGYVSRTFTGVTVGSASATLLNVKLSPVESVAPTVTSFVALKDSLPIRLDLGFSEYVAESLTAGDLSLQNLSTGQSVAITQGMLSYGTAGTNVASISLATAPADGRYRLTVAAGSVSDLAGNAIVGAVARDFAMLRGDANNDNAVNFDDLLALAANYNASPRTFSQGDFNYSGAVDFDDLLLLAARYNQTLSAGAPPVATLPEDDTPGITGDVLA